MSAIAGCIGRHVQNLADDCDAILTAIAPYGVGPPHRSSLPGASMGYIPSNMLPEDRFGSQPVSDGRYMLVADIRFDNRPDVESALGVRSVELSDAGLLLRCWQCWGRQTLDRIIGDFAFALFDTVERKLVLARDQTGQRPLFFVESGGGLAFASMPSGLLALPWNQPRFNGGRLAAARLGGVDFTAATYFQGISRVLPGHIAVVDAGRLRQEPFWEPPREWLDQSDEVLVETYRDSFRAIVGAQSRRAEGRLGTHLSSGWDSNAVTAFASEGLRDTVAFTAAPRIGFAGPVPRGRVADEVELAGRTASQYGLEHRIIRPADGPLDQLRRLARLYQEPEFNVVNLEWWTAILRGARDMGCRTLLTGQMGNLSVHAGGLWVLAEWIRQGRWKTWAKEARAAKKNSTASWRGTLFNSLQEWLPQRVIRALERSAGIAAPEEDMSFLRREWLDAGRAYSTQSGWLSDRPRRYALRLGWIRSQDHGVFRAGAFADCGVDERDPFADRRMLDFSFQLSPDKYLHDGRWRPLARKALSGIVPSEVLDSPVRGYQGADWFERISPRIAHDLLDELANSHAACEFLDICRLRSMIERWPSSGTASGIDTAIYRTGLLGALSFGTFVQEFEKSTA